MIFPVYSQFLIHFVVVVNEYSPEGAKQETLHYKKNSFNRKKSKDAHDVGMIRNGLQT